MNSEHLGMWRMWKGENDILMEHHMCQYSGINHLNSGPEFSNIEKEKNLYKMNGKLAAIQALNVTLLIPPMKRLTGVHLQAECQDICHREQFTTKLYHHLNFGPGVLPCATRGGGRSEAGHCFHLLLVQACLRAPLFSPTLFFLFLSTPSALQPLQGCSGSKKNSSPHILA